MIFVQFESDWLENVKFVGWERNEKGNFGPKQVNLKSSLDPQKYLYTVTQNDFP